MPTQPDRTHPLGRLDTSIELSTAYLLRLQRSDGSFVYRRHLTEQGPTPWGYNILRHAGAMYALADAADHGFHRSEIREVLGRSAAVLADRLRTVPDRPDLRAVASLPVIDDERAATAKLGGSGLGLVALIAAERLGTGTVPARELRAVADFIRFMQRPDGSFISKYSFSEPVGPVTDWTSLYYPGEAALGLIELAELEQDPFYSDLAVRALLYLAHSRRGEQRVPPDHWALLATARLAGCRSVATLSAEDRRLLHDHARDICRDIVADRPSPRTHRGALTPGCETTSTATRLEGLLAAAASVDLGPIRPVVERVIDSGVRFLLRAQITEGEEAGAFTLVAPESLDAADADADAERVDGESIRIDFVQHALSVLLAYRARKADTDPVARRASRPSPGRPPIKMDRARIDVEPLAVKTAQLLRADGAAPTTITEESHPGLFRLSNDFAHAMGGQLHSAHVVAIESTSIIEVGRPTGRLSWSAERYVTPISRSSELQIVNVWHDRVALRPGEIWRIESLEPAHFANNGRGRAGLLDLYVGRGRLPDPTDNFALVEDGIDVAPFVRELQAKPELWTVDTSRQRKVRPHRETQNISLRTGWYHGDVMGTPGEVQRSRMTWIAARLPELSVWLEDFCGRNGLEPGSARLVRLEPGGHVLNHVDRGSYYRLRDRYHLVLTGGRSTLSSGDATIMPHPGELWRFNNQLPHEAANYGTASRIHLIFDARSWTPIGSPADAALARFEWPAFGSLSPSNGRVTAGSEKEIQWTS